MTKLNEAFKRFRRAGLVARQNFLCCSGCAGYALTLDIEKRIDAGKDRPKGVIFYHRQDAEALRDRPSRPFESRQVAEDRTMCLRYGQVNSSKYGWIGEDTAEVGRLVCAVLADVGIGYDWSGDPNKCINISVADALAPAPPPPLPVTRLPRRTSPRQLASQAERQGALEAAATALVGAVEG
jgi:hypothetical protein